MSDDDLPVTRAEIDLAAFDENVRRVRQRVAPADLMFVVKNDAYGHGSDVLVPRAVRAGVRWVGCLELAAAQELRRGGAEDVRLFAWLLAPGDDFAAGIAAGIDFGVGDADVLEAVAAAPGMARVHLKADTGLNRNGVREEEWPAFVRRAAELEAAGLIRVVGILSHISEASDADDDAARGRFDASVAAAREAGLSPEVRHLAASAAGFLRPEFRYDLVRVGAFCYGIAPAGGPDEDALGITPVLSLKSAVVGVRDGGATAVVPVGAWHGLPSIAAGRVTIAVDGRPLLVREIRRDLLLADTAGAEVRPGAPVTVFGSGAGAISATRWAEAIDTIGEEIVLRLDTRIPRVYLG